MDIRAQPHLLHPADAGLPEATDNVPQDPSSTPRLGDFSKLLIYSAPRSQKSTQSELQERTSSHWAVGQLFKTEHDDPDARRTLMLGNFSKVFSRLESPVQKLTSEGNNLNRKSEPLPIPEADTRARRRSRRQRACADGSTSNTTHYDSTPAVELPTKDEKPQPELMSDTSISALSETESAEDFEVSELSSATTPSSSLGKRSGFPNDAVTAPAISLAASSSTHDSNARALFDWSPQKDQQHLPSKSLIDVSTPSKRVSRGVRSRQHPILSYQLAPNGPFYMIPNSGRTVEEKHRSLLASLTTHSIDDVVVGSLHPMVQANGIHVFLDMSNIQISLHHALRYKFSLDPSARFKPLPRLNMEFLTEILVRQREVRVLNAGCSMRPDRSEPCFIGELRRLGYRVDVRERIRVEGAKSPGPSPSKRTSSPEDVRYVEDLVDETLQIRIGESVMECFQEQGTIVLATGDAKPAKYSDGFFTYAERALRMGWNVEVVSWNLSLSSAWKAPAWTSRWGQRFRLIELDDFLDDLWEI